MYKVNPINFSIRGNDFNDTTSETSTNGKILIPPEHVKLTSDINCD